MHLNVEWQTIKQFVFVLLASKCLQKRSSNLISPLRHLSPTFIWSPKKSTASTADLDIPELFFLHFFDWLASVIDLCFMYVCECECVCVFMCYLPPGKASVQRNVKLAQQSWTFISYQLLVVSEAKSFSVGWLVSSPSNQFVCYKKRRRRRRRIADQWCNGNNKLSHRGEKK